MRIGTTLDIARTTQELADLATEHFADLVTVDLLDSVLDGDDPPAEGPLVLRRFAQRSAGEDAPGIAADRPEQIHTFRTDRRRTAPWPPGSPPGITSTAPACGSASGCPPHRRRAPHPLDAGRAAACPRHAPWASRCSPGTATPEPLRRRRPARSPQEIAARAAVASTTPAATPTRAPPPSPCSAACSRAAAASSPPWRSPAATCPPAPRPAWAATGSTSSRCPAPGSPWWSATWSATASTPPPPWAGCAPRCAPWPTSTCRPTSCSPTSTTWSSGCPPEARPARTTDERSGTSAPPACTRSTTPSPAAAPWPAPATRCPPWWPRTAPSDLLDLPAGPPLGLGGLPFEAAEVELPEGSLLALYTDGLIEARDRDVEAGLDAAAPRPRAAAPLPGGDLRHRARRPAARRPTRRRRRAARWPAPAPSEPARSPPGTWPPTRPSSPGPGRAASGS